MKSYTCKFFSLGWIIFIPADRVAYPDLGLVVRMAWNGLTTYGLTIPARISGLSKIALDSSPHQEKDMRLPRLETSCTPLVGALMKVWI
jgi:hypothetical protein